MLFPMDDLPSKPADLESDSAFSVVVAYQDVEMGKHAQGTCDFLMESLAGECRFISKMWRFDALAVPSLRDLAAKDAALADLIFVSSHGREELPADVKAWIELWLGRKSTAFALVGLFGDEGKDAALVHSVQDYLAWVAKRGEMEFFAQPDVWPNDKFQGNRKRPHVPVILPEPMHPVAAVSTKNVNPRYWGLNE